MDFPYFSQMKHNEWFSLSRDSKLDKTMPPPSSSHSHQSISTTTHHQPKYILHDPTPPTTSQNISTTTHHHPPTATMYLPSSTSTHQEPKYIHHCSPQSKINPSKKVFYKRNIKIFYSEVYDEKHFD